MKPATPARNGPRGPNRPVGGSHSPGRRSRGLRLVSAGLVVGCAALSLSMVPAPVAGAATQSVTNCGDSGPGSLRQAVMDAAAGDTISFALAPSCSFIDLKSTIDIATDITIVGPGASALRVSESVHNTAFSVPAGVTVSISGLTIENGSIGIDNAGIVTLTAVTLYDNGSDAGGAVVNRGTLTLTDSTAMNNGVDAPDEGGGAVDNEGGAVTITGSTLSDDTASGGANGGAIFNNDGSVTISNSTLSDDTTSHGSGGGIYNDGGTVSVTTTLLTGSSALDGTGGAVDNDTGTVTVTDSTLRHNSAFYSLGGGAVFNGGTMTIGDSTLYRNSATYAGEGGAVHNAGTLALSASTVAHNAAAFNGGGLFGPATVVASIVAENGTGGDCSQTVTDGGYNLDDDGTCGFTATTDRSDTPSGLAPGAPADNGGPTKTIALEAGSPAIDAVTSATLCAIPDQRGVLRPTPCDIGAVNLVLPPQAITSPGRATATVGSPFSFTVTTTGVPVPTIKANRKLPKHLKLVQNGNGTATITGTPVKAGVSTFTLGAIYNYGDGVPKTVVTQVFTLTVVNAT
jgi:hypothetical protein